MLPHRSSRTGGAGSCRLGMAAVGLALLLGCTPKPVAPALRDEPVYQNDQEGFRFLVPEGWSQNARTEVPPGPVEKERLLVQYKRRPPAKPATLEVSMADLPSSTNLATYL